jgi:hypothetical protein
MWITCHITRESWIVTIGDAFEPAFDVLHEEVQTETLALSRLLQRCGPQFGRPHVDALKVSRHASMKELCFSAAGGERPSPSIRRARRSCWLRRINRGSAKDASTGR